MNCPHCKNVIPEKIMQSLIKGELNNCPSCSYLLKGEDLYVDRMTTVLRSSDESKEQTKSRSFYCPACSSRISEDAIKNLKDGHYETCPKCDYLLRGEEFGFVTQDPISKGESSIISKLTEESPKKKSRKLKAYYCPFCNAPDSRLTENQLNLIEMGMSVDCKKCGKSIKDKHLKL